MYSQHFFWKWKMGVTVNEHATAVTRGGMTGAVQLKQLATDYSQQKHTTWAGRGRIIIAQSKANCLSCTAPVVPPLSCYYGHRHVYLLCMRRLTPTCTKFALLFASHAYKFRYEYHYKTCNPTRTHCSSFKFRCTSNKS